eukprot:19211-Pyramimonas_sp.AAC.2
MYPTRSATLSIVGCSWSSPPPHDPPRRCVNSLFRVVKELPHTRHSCSPSGSTFALYRLPEAPCEKDRLCSDQTGFLGYNRCVNPRCVKLVVPPT